MSKPRILIVTQIFPPETQGTAVIILQLCHHLRQQGWDVGVVTCFPSHPQGTVYDGYRKQLWMRDEVEGLPVLRAWHLTHPSRKLPVRSSMFVSQAMGNAAGALLSGRPDIMLVAGPTIVGPLLNWAVAKLHGCKVANIIYDVHPELAIETGHVRNPALVAAARVASQLEFTLMDGVITCADDLKRTLCNKGAPPDKVHVVPIWLEKDEIVPGNRDNAWRREQGIPLDKTVVLHAGTLGVPSGATVIAEAANLLREREDLLFVLVGEGSAKPAVEARAKELKLSNMLFLPFQPRERLPELQASGDFGLVTYLHGRHRTSWPSKMLGYMAAGRPILASIDPDSDTAREMEQQRFGLVVPAEDPRALADGVVRMADDAAQLKAFGEAARQRFEERYTRQQVLETFQAALEKTLAS